MIVRPYTDRHAEGRAAHANVFQGHLEGALSNAHLRDTLIAFQQGGRPARDHEIEQIDFAMLRSEMKRAKTAVTSDFEGYLRRFRSAAEGAGATVHPRFAAGLGEAFLLITLGSARGS